MDSNLITSKHRYAPLQVHEDDDGASHSLLQQDCWPRFRSMSLQAVALFFMTCAFVAVSFAFTVYAQKDNASYKLPTRGWSLAECKSTELLDSMHITDLRFGTKHDFMSLDHRFDHLWAEDLRPARSVVWLPGQLKNEVGSGMGAISMYV